MMIRKLAIAALVVAFFLPLTKCTSVSPNGGTADDFRYPVENVMDGLAELRKTEADTSGSVMLAVLTLAVFFIPLSLITLPPKVQAWTHVVTAVPAEWLLYHWTTVGTPQFGGILAMLCWLVLVCLGIASITASRNAT